MRKALTIALALTMVLAFAVPAMAQGALTSKANEWYYTSDVAGTVTVADNKVEFTYRVNAGEVTLLGKQSGYTGQLKFVSFLSDCEAFGHEFINDTGEFVPPTCTEMGYNIAECSRAGCNETGPRYLPEHPALGHEFINDTGVVLIERTCTEDGLNEAACSRAGCDEIGTRFLPALGHTYDEGAIHIPGRCFYPNTWIYTCINEGCDDFYLEEVAAFGAHNLVQYEYYQNWQTGKYGWRMICVNPGCDYHEFVEDVSAGEIAAELLGGLTTAEIVANLSNQNNILTLTIGDEVFELGATNGNSLNGKGEVFLGDGWWLVYEITGNGS
ncbi:MAG: hypothetical protein FWD21_03785, partial [Peptococcaceae bacterium]|nr:hypothetical protein [Peptococcaceae bacterium]